MLYSLNFLISLSLLHLSSCNIYAAHPSVPRQTPSYATLVKLANVLTYKFSDFFKGYGVHRTGLQVGLLLV